MSKLTDYSALRSETGVGRDRFSNGAWRLSSLPIQARRTFDELQNQSMLAHPNMSCGVLTYSGLKFPAKQIEKYCLAWGESIKKSIVCFSDFCAANESWDMTNGGRVAAYLVKKGYDVTASVPTLNRNSKQIIRVWTWNMIKRPKSSRGTMG